VCSAFPTFNFCVEINANKFIIYQATFLSIKEVIPEVHERLICKLEGRM
jgi:hypothetical protein